MWIKGFTIQIYFNFFSYEYVYIQIIFFEIVWFFVFFSEDGKKKTDNVFVNIVGLFLSY